MVGLCVFSQSYPRNTLSFPSCVTPQEISSTCSFMIIQACTISLMEPVPFRVPSALLNQECLWYFVCGNALCFHKAFIYTTPSAADIKQHLNLECPLIVSSYNLTVDFEFILSNAS